MKKAITSNLYLILSIILIAFESIHIYKGDWIGDFWEHAAVINELSNNLLNPNNPIIGENTAHAFFSPYSVLLGLISKTTHLNSIQVLIIFSFINLITLLFSFYFFCKNTFHKNYQLIASLSLVLILFFWGESPTSWSGFYHIFALHYILPYPSTVAFSLTLFFIGLIAKHDLNKLNRRGLFISLIGATIFITHPTTGIVALTGAGVLLFSKNDYKLTKWGKQFSIIAIPLLILSISWPYYNFISLFTGDNSDFQIESKALYNDLFRQYWPVLLCIPSLFFIKRNKTLFFLVGTLISLLALLIIGNQLEIFGLGRVVSNLVITAHIIIAYTLILFYEHNKLNFRIYISAITAFLYLSISLNYDALKTVLSTCKTPNVQYYNGYNFLRTEVQPQDIILSDKESNWLIPTFGGKVISSVHPLYWVNDLKERRMDIDIFFKEKCSNTIRLNILKKYKPKYILINYNFLKIAPEDYQIMYQLGKTIYYKNNFRLIKLNPTLL